MSKLKPKTPDARSGYAERTTAQPECIKFLNTIGYAEKHRDVQATACPVCGSAVTINEHTAPGVADYLGSVRNNPYFGCGPISYAVEVKASDGVGFPMKRIAPEQWAWAEHWEEKTGGTAWFWLMIGPKEVDATLRLGASRWPDPLRRRTYLVPRHDLQPLAWLIDKATNGGQSTLYATRDVPNQRFSKAYHGLGLYADEYLSHWALNWHGGGVWWPGVDHLWWNTYDVEEQDRAYKPKESTHEQPQLI